MGVQAYDWAKIKTEYITGNVSIRDLCEKYNCPKRTMQIKCKNEKWVQARKDYQKQIVKKAVQKEADRRATALAKEFRAVDKLSDIIVGALEDEYQFNRWLVDERIGDGYSETSEKVFDKMDMRSLKDAAGALKLIEQMKRTIDGLLTEQEAKNLELAERRMALDEKRADADVNPKDTTVVVRFEGDNAEDWSE